jgi:hypothetical protein
VLELEPTFELGFQQSWSSGLEHRSTLALFKLGLRFIPKVLRKFLKLPARKYQLEQQLKLVVAIYFEYSK